MINLDRFRDVDLVIDKANDNFIAKQWTSTGDKEGRTLTVMLTNGGIVGELTGVTASLLWTNKANGLTDETAFVLKDKATSTFVIEYPSNMLTPGTVIAQIRIWYDGKVVSTKPFEIEVGGIAGVMAGVVKQQEFGLLTAVLADASNLKGFVINELERVSAGAYDTVNSIAELNQKYPNGAPGNANVVVLEADGVTGFQYTFTNGSWKKGAKVQSQGIAKKSVDFTKLADDAVNEYSASFIERGENLFDKTEFVDNRFFGAGKFNEAQGYKVSKPIFVKAFHTIYFPKMGGLGDNNDLAITTQQGSLISSATSETHIDDVRKFQYPNDVFVVLNLGSSLNSLDYFYVTYNPNFKYVPYGNRLKGITITEDNIKNSVIDGGRLKIRTVESRKTDFILHSANLFNKNDSANLEGGYFVNIDGIQKHPTSTLYALTHPIWLEPGMVSTYFPEEYGNTLFCLKISKKISNYPFYEFSLPILRYDGIPNGIAEWEITQAGYYIFNYTNRTKDNFMVVATDKNNYPSEYIAYKRSLAADINIATDSKKIRWGIIGDSLSDKRYVNFDMYMDYIKTRSNYDLSVQNVAVAGSGFVKREDSNECFYQRLSLIDDDVDFITVMGSFNDLFVTQPMGDIDDDFNAGSVFGYINHFFDVYDNLHAGKPLGIILTPPWSGRRPGDFSADRYINGLIDICKKNTVPYLDLYHQSQLKPWHPNYQILFYNEDDFVHPNTKGHKHIAPKVDRFIQSLI